MSTYIKGESGVLQVYSEFRVGTRGFEYKIITKAGIKVMEHVLIWEYASFKVGVLFLIVLVLFSWFALRKIQQSPFRSILIGTGVVGLNYQSDRIVGVWLELILGCPMSPSIVFANPTFIHLSPFVLSFV
jgi:hypothetical protein